MQREKRTYSGPLFEVDFYPVFADGRRMPTRSPKSKPSTEEQQKYNRTIATKKLIRLVNANFDTTDYLLHPTYKPSEAPQSEEEARRDIVNYLRRVRTRRDSELRRVQKDLADAEHAAAKMPQNRFLAGTVEKLKKKIDKLSQPFRYIYVIEKQTYKSGAFAGRANYHFHLFLTGGIEAATLEATWTNGIRTNCNRYQPDKFGPEAAARYMSKDPQGSKRFSYSRNLIQPKTKTKDGTVSARTVEKMATLRVDDRDYWEKRYKNYRFVRCYTRFNEYNGQWYVSVIMYKTDGTPPEWKENDWITTDFI